MYQPCDGGTARYETGKHRPRQLGTYASPRCRREVREAVDRDLPDRAAGVPCRRRRGGVAPPAARVPMPKVVAKPERVREVDAWDEDQIDVFLATIEGHRWGAP